MLVLVLSDHRGQQNYDLGLKFCDNFSYLGVFSTQWSRQFVERVRSSVPIKTNETRVKLVKCWTILEHHKAVVCFQICAERYSESHVKDL